MSGSSFTCSRLTSCSAGIFPDLPSLSKLLFTLTIIVLPLAARSQDDAFLRCADITERDARVQCLEDALQQAVNTREPAPAPSASIPAATTPRAQTAAPAAPAAVPEPSTATAVATDSDARRFDLFGLFDREEEQRVRKEQQAAESMRAKVTVLDYYKPDVLTITLENGQIWRQLFARRYNLREGDVVLIYQSGWGDQFRLEAERFNGFIAVERLR